MADQSFFSGKPKKRYRPVAWIFREYQKGRGLGLCSGIAEYVLIEEGEKYSL
jgi:hypothetical protein